MLLSLIHTTIALPWSLQVNHAEWMLVLLAGVLLVKGFARIFRTRRE